jgi:tetratricopeptide (TPR) repeat protein
MNADQNRLMEILSETLNQPTPEARARYLAEACGGDEALRRQVEGLLDAHTKAGDFLKPPTEDAPENDSPGTVIGRYQLLQRIGEGGFGQVYMAEQLEPVRRKVAVKVIKLGMDTREVVARFEAERQALAMMEHPNIAKVLDGGTTGMGRPYFVMELVKGVPITDYCDQNRYSPEQRLRLFLKVCHAVQHAHQKGVIHRDLKPSNILVTEQDGEAVPKVIDFGVAKAIGPSLTDRLLFTRFEQLIGTPTYMSPEQAGLGSLDLDTRTDIYSLGVLLYQLLTSTTPVQAETLHQAALDEVRRMIREMEPPKPSTRLQALGAKLTEVAEQRHLEPRTLRRLVAGDLDWIVMKALEKDRRRRYETADALAQDLERHLKHLPVQASPPSAAYRVRKFVRRHRLGVGVAGAVSGALIAGLILALLGLGQAQREREYAQQQAALAKAINAFLQELLSAASPDSEVDRDLKVRTALDRASGSLAERFKDQPDVRGGTHQNLGNIYRSLGEYAAAEQHLQQAIELATTLFGSQAPKTLEVKNSLGLLYVESGRFDECIAFLKDLLEVERRVLGKTDPETVLGTVNNLAVAYNSLGRSWEAEPLFREVSSGLARLIGPEHRETLVALHNVAFSRMGQGRWEEAERLFRQNLDQTRRVCGPQSPDTGRVLHSLGVVLGLLGRLEESTASLQEALTVRRHVLGPAHRATLLTQREVAACSARAAQWSQSARQYSELAQSASPDLLDFSYGAIVADLAGDRQGALGQCRELAGRFGGLTNPVTASEVSANLCLLLREGPDDLSAGLELPVQFLDRATAGDKQARWFRLLHGMVQYRLGHWEQAATSLEAVLSGRDADYAWFSGYLAAAARYQLGDTNAGWKLYQQCQEKLALVLARGSLGKMWIIDARALIARSEAERVIFGRIVSPPVDAAALASHRQDWRLIQQRFSTANAFAAQQKWPQARDAYRQAAEDPRFFWAAAEYDSELVPLEMAAALLMAGDYEAHERLCRQLFANEPDAPGRLRAEVRLKMWFMRPRDRSVELDQRATELLRFIPDKSKLADASGDYWTWLNRGLAAYRQGNLAEASECLKHARRSEDVGCRGAATVFLAMTEQRSGRHKQAVRLLQDAEAILTEPLRTLTGSAWPDLCVCHLALQEARNLIQLAN